MPHRTLAALVSMLLVLTSSAKTSEEYLFRMLDTSSGLPDNNVRNMTMLPDGLMCIQTSTMLSLYNGASCKSYKYNPMEIPYTEYSGLNGSCFDEASDLLWCTSRDHIWIFDLGTGTFEYDVKGKFAPFGLGNENIANLFIDSEGTYWVTTEDARLFRCIRNGVAESGPDAGVSGGSDAGADALETEQVALPHDIRGPLLFAQSGSSIWILSINGILTEYDLLKKTVLRSVRLTGSPEGDYEPSRIDMTTDSEGNVWVMSDRLLAYFHRDSGEMTGMSGILKGKEDLYTTIAIDGHDNLWVGTARSGVSLIDGNTMEIRTFPYLMQTNGKKIYPHTDISKIYVDRRGGVWIATLAEGLLFWHKDIYHLHTVNSSTLSGGKMPDEGVKCMIEDADGTVLVGTIDGLLRYDPRTNTMSVPYAELRNELCISLYRDSRDRIWLGTFYNGAFCIDKGRIRHYSFPETSSAELSYYTGKPNLNCVRAFYEDYLGNFWISVYGGVGKFDTGSGRIELLRDSHPEVSRFMIVRDVCDHGDGLLLFSGDNGRFLYSPSEDRVDTDLHSMRCYIQSNQAIRDERGLLWIAASDGLSVTDLSTGEVYTVGVDSGLPNDNIISITADDTGNVWAATFGSISRIRPMKKDGRYVFPVSNFNEADGVTAGAFFQNSVLKHSSGDIFFGGAHGITCVQPDRLYQDTFDISPYISDVIIAGEKVDFTGRDSGKGVIWTGAGTERKNRPGGGSRKYGSAGRHHIDLKHDESSVTFCFSNLNYINPSHTSYRYILENFDKSWTELHSQSLGRAAYTYLKPGDYVFRVYAADNGTDWSRLPAEISLTVHPPFWKSTAAYILYVLFLTGGIYVAVSFYLRRKKAQILLDRKMQLQEQREELDQMKFRFFTNISHELRTPLSLILLPLESIMKEMKESDLYPKLETMHHNARELLSLVNHLLDFRKLEMGGEKLHLVRGDIAEFASETVSSFRGMAQRKNISLGFENGLTDTVMAFDKSQLSKIMNNLLSNAMKFTPEGGYVSMELSQTEENGCRMLRMDVSDTGTGIPRNDLDHIFDRFYQSGNAAMTTGSGIGLSLVKQYAEMHQGRVGVSSEVGKGTVFSVWISMDMETAPAAEADVGKTADRSVSGPDVPVTEVAGNGGSRQSRSEEKSRHTVMIVDDNADFRSYLKSEIGSQYNVVTASDGEACLSEIRIVQPDVLVCDVMMPGIDGFEVTKRIKGNIETSHIPVILLTARTSDDVRLEGYETGADAYLTKPFQMDILEARIKNLIEERQGRISSFSKAVDVNPSEVTMTPIDEKLMSKIMESIERNMDNAGYSVEELSSDVSMHRMNLYRKLQSLVGMTPSEFIRSVRVKRAAHILTERPDISLSELADLVGFNTPKYLTRYFREMFGCSPSQYPSHSRK